MKIECNIPDETKDVVAKLVDRKNKTIARFNENNPEEKQEKATLSSMCAELITTGAFRRVAANRWADEHPKAKKPRKAKAAAPKAKKPRTAKAAAPKAKKDKKVVVKKNGEEPKPAATPSPLD
jgi:hypothetical protein